MKIKNFIINYFLGLGVYALAIMSLVSLLEPNDMIINILKLGVSYFFIITVFIHLISKFLKNNLSQNHTRVELINITIILSLILFNITNKIFSIILATIIVLIYNFLHIRVIKNKYILFLNDLIVNFFIIMGIYSFLALFMFSIFITEKITNNAMHNLIGLTVAGTIMLISIPFILIIIMPSLYLFAHFINKKILEKNYILLISIITMIMLYLAIMFFIFL